MLCDKYKKRLSEAAASYAALSNALREHAQACAICGARLAAERTLFAAIDGGLHKAANAKMRSAFLPNVKASLATETVSARSPIPGWALMCATGALAVAVAFLSLPRGAHDKARAAAITVTSKVPAGASELGLALVPEHKIRYSARALKAPAQQNVAGIASHEPQVLVQPEEEEVLKRFYTAVRNQDGDQRAVVTGDNEITPNPLVIEQIEVRDLRIENLDEEFGLAQTDTK